MDGSNRN